MSSLAPQGNEMSCAFKLFLRADSNPIWKMKEARDGGREPCSSTFWLCEAGPVTAPYQSLSFYFSKKEVVSPDLPSPWGDLKVFQLAVRILHEPAGMRRI